MYVYIYIYVYICIICICEPTSTYNTMVLMHLVSTKDHTLPLTGFFKRKTHIQIIQSMINITPLPIDSIQPLILIVIRHFLSWTNHGTDPPPSVRASCFCLASSLRLSVHPAGPAVFGGKNAMDRWSINESMWGFPSLGDPHNSLFHGKSMRQMD